MKKSLIIAGIIGLAVAVPLVKKYAGSSDVKQVEVGALAVHPIKASVIASGNLSHEEKVLLSTEVIGKVKAIYVKEGDKVSKLQLLLQIDDEAYVSATEQNQAAVRLQKIAIQRLEASLANTQLQWQRKKTLLDKKLIDQQTFDEIDLALSAANFQLQSGREQLIQAEEQLAQAKNSLAKTRVYSPIDGVVTSLNIKVGETAIAGTMNFAASTLMVIANPASLRAEVNVDEADISKVAVGQKAEIIAVARSDQAIPGKVDFIAETAKVAQGRNGLSFAVKIRLDDANQMKLWPGMSARAEIFVSDQLTRLAVPLQAVVVQEDDKQRDDKNKKGSGNSKKSVKPTYVFVETQGKAKRIPVTLGLSDDEYQEVSGELKAGDNIILGPDRILRYLKDGEAVAVEATKNNAAKTEDNKVAAAEMDAR
jgi:HlyD family secretion protein